MQRLMEQSHWLRKIRSFWQASGKGKLLAVVLVSAWLGIKAASWTGAPDDASQASTGEYSLAPGVEPPKSMLARAQRIEAQRLQADTTGSMHQVSNQVAAPPRRESADPLTCLALNIYWEARNQAVSGQLAVAQVTLNRVADRRYADNLCDVVYEHRQFSWYWDGKPDTPKELRAWETAYLIASAAMHGSGFVDLQGVTHYHAVYVKPYWKDHMIQIAMIGDHIFYAE